MGFVKVKPGFKICITIFKIYLAKRIKGIISKFSVNVIVKTKSNSSSFKFSHFIYSNFRILWQNCRLEIPSAFYFSARIFIRPFWDGVGRKKNDVIRRYNLKFSLKKPLKLNFSLLKHGRNNRIRFKRRVLYFFEGKRLLHF